MFTTRYVFCKPVSIAGSQTATNILLGGPGGLAKGLLIPVNGSAELTVSFYTNNNAGFSNARVACVLDANTAANGSQAFGQQWVGPIGQVTDKYCVNGQPVGYSLGAVIDSSSNTWYQHVIRFAGIPVQAGYIYLNMREDGSNSQPLTYADVRVYERVLTLAEIASPLLPNDYAARFTFAGYVDGDLTIPNLAGGAPAQVYYAPWSRPIHALDTTHPAALVSNGNGLSTWQDVSGHGFDLVAQPGKEPIISLDGDGKYSIHFSPAQNMSLASGTYLAGNNGFTEWTYALVVYCAPGNSPYVGIWNGLNTPGGNPNSLFIDPYQYGLGLNSSFPRIGGVSTGWSAIIVSSSLRNATSYAYVTGSNANGVIQLPYSSVNDNLLRGCTLGGGSDINVRVFQLHGQFTDANGIRVLLSQLQAQTGLAL